jgi:hypothetical protein
MPLFARMLWQKERGPFERGQLLPAAVLTTTRTLNETSEPRCKHYADHVDARVRSG